MEEASRKGQILMIPLCEVPRVLTFIDRTWKGGCQGLEGGEKGELFNGYRVLVLQGERSSVDWLYNVNVL